MAEGGSRPLLGIILAIVSFIIAVLMFTARVLPEDPTARIILGFLFIGIGILWVIRYSQSKNKTE
jgi:positive regulator of sigma E activity